MAFKDNSDMPAEEFRTLVLKEERSAAGTILWVTLNRPQAYNAVSMEMLEELHTVFDSLHHPSSMLESLEPDFPRVVILRGAGGRAFSGGVDIKAADQGIGGAAWDYHDIRSQQLLSRLIEKFRSVPQPIIAAVQGAASGAGFAFALASDVRIATQSSRFNAAFVKLGLTGTDMGTSYFLPRVAGLGIASELLLTGRPIAAERAYQVGLVNELVPDNATALEEAARKLAQEMLQCTAKGLQLTKEQLNSLVMPSFALLLPSLYLLQGLQLTKEQLNSVADGGSLRTALVAENSHQILLVNDPVAKQIAQRWMRTLIDKSKARSKI
ncbi:hypothetical protein N2152v2_001467 [Parachlorella kessleri]